MVQATSINDVKKRYLVVYATVLSVIFVLLTIIVFIFLTDRNLRKADSEDLDALIQNRQFEVNKLEQLNNEFNLEFDKLNTMTKLKDRKKQLTLLQDLNKGRSEELDKVFDYSEKILKLGNNDDTNIIRQYDSISRELYFEYDSLLSFDSITNNYYIQAQASNSCFNKINFEDSNKKVVAALEKCINEINKERDLVNDLPYETKETVEYLNKKKEYWQATRSLYAAIEAQDEDQAKTLRKSINTLDKEKDKLRTSSDKEITNLISIHLQEIRSLESTLEQL
ncbi:hypothetical protein KC622_00305 [Candidatus Dojkabacteria bacterium]|uniref:Uncharacterized protein n=1 Tax=Candidatus Dojkabacteria bacterium TaxID=2099670 RepID=A0A955HY92_9BACT|nr:hypothetical protein [Candidatus Dojkabacteria bacterium]